MCSHSVPSRGQLDRRRSRTCQGVGKITLRVAATSTHHSAISSAITTMSEEHLLEPASCRTFASYRPLRLAATSRTPPAEPRPRRRRDTARRRCVICPLACAVQANWIARRGTRTAAGSSGPASSGSGRRSAARRRGCCSTRTSRTPSVRRISAGRISTGSPAMRRAQVPFGISKSSSRDSERTGARAPHPARRAHRRPDARRGRARGLATAPSGRARPRRAHGSSRISTSCAKSSDECPYGISARSCRGGRSGT